MLSKITSGIKWLLAAFATIAGVYFMGRKSASDEAKADAEKQAHEQERRANKAMQNGLANEQKVRDEIRNNPGNRVDLD